MITQSHEKLASFRGQFFINRTDEKNRPGIDCIGFVHMHKIEFKRKIYGLVL